MFKKFAAYFLSAFLAMGAMPVFASTASQVVTGSYSTTACGNAPKPCFIENPATGAVAAANTYAWIGASTGFYATPQDTFCVSGSATKTVEITTFALLVNSTSATLIKPTIIKYSTAPTGGTATTLSAIAYDSSEPAATGSAEFFTAAPTSGTVVGTLRLLYATTTVTASAPTTLTFNYNFYNASTINAYDRPITLHGTGETVCFNFAGAALPSGFTAIPVLQTIEY